MSCREFKTSVAAYADKGLRDNEEQEFEEHLSHCQACSKDVEQFKKLNEMITDASPVIPYMDLTYSIISQIKAQARKRFRLMIRDITAAAAAAIIVFWVSSPVLINNQASSNYSSEVVKVSDTVGGVFRSYMSFASDVSGRLSNSLENIIPELKKGEENFEL